jgi:hypothetical protein
VRSEERVLVPVLEFLSDDQITIGMRRKPDRVGPNGSEHSGYFIRRGAAPEQRRDARRVALVFIARNTTDGIPGCPQDQPKLFLALAFPSCCPFGVDRHRRKLANGSGDIPGRWPMRPFWRYHHGGQYRQSTAPEGVSLAERALNHSRH